MKKRDFILAALSPAHFEQFTPVQVQKLFFLLDENIARQVEGPHFEFEPYHYGPYDKDVYLELNLLKEEGLVEIFQSNVHGLRAYRLTSEGYKIGSKALGKLPKSVQNYTSELVKLIRSLSFIELVTLIYKNYPEMRENSVFAGQNL